MTDITVEGFGVIIIILRWVGLYHYDTQSLIFQICTYTSYFSSVVITTLLAVNLLLGDNSDFERTSRSMIYLSTSMCGCFKLLTLLTKGSKIKNCIHFFQNQQSVNLEEDKILRNCVRVCRRNFHIYFSVLGLIEMSWNVLPFLEEERRFSVDVWLPMELTSRPVLFGITYLYIVIVNIYFGVAMTTVEVLLGDLSYYGTSQLKILKYHLRNFAESITQISQASRVRYEIVSQILKKCVENHNKILKFFSEYEDCFSWCLLYQIGATTFGLCFCCIGFTSTSSTITTNCLIFIPCYFYLSCQLFFYCHYGTLLFEENNGLRDAIYMGQWQNYDVRIQRMLLIIMERSKMPLTLTAGGVVNLTYETFTSALKTSYSLIAVLKSYQ